MGYDAPMKNPRITITLQPKTHAIIKELSRLNDESQSAIVGSMLEQVTPVLERMIAIMQAAEQAKDAVRGRLAGDMEAAQAKVEQSLGIVMEQFGEMEQPFLELFEDIKRRSPKAAAVEGAGAGGAAKTAAAAATTPPSNRGVRSSPEKLSKQAQMRAAGDLVDVVTHQANPPKNTSKNSPKKRA